jgi:hypothetical protein
VLWYNPTIKSMEDAPAPLVDAQAIEMLSGHPDSEEFIEEYRRRHATSGIVEALMLTGQTFLLVDQRATTPKEVLGQKKGSGCYTRPFPHPY